MREQRSLRLLFITTAFLFLFPLNGFSSVSMMETAGEARPDILTIDMPSSPDYKDMPAVRFKHDLHTRAVDGQCSKCHDSKDGRIVFKFKRTETVAGDSYMDLYHDNCVACHAEMEGKDGGKGPMEAECRTCHNAGKETASSWKKIQFSRSLHYAHESADAIKSKIKTEETNCSACHHSANIKAKETFYEKGKESACVYCHTPEGKEGVRTIQEASHDSCVACHQTLTEQKIKAGPVDCAGCHTQEAQKKIKTVKDRPRLQRNQPDQALLTGWEGRLKTGVSDTEANRKIISQFMDAVPFDHKGHELANTSCKTCHHQTLDKCSSCHTVKGDVKGGYVKLSDAMHDSNASQSCIGCHNEKQAAKECAGCHTQMPQKETPDQNCAVCHAVDVKTAPMENLGDDAAKAEMARTALDSRSYQKINLSDIPEMVVIDDLAKEYQPSNFPHRMMVESIFKQVEGSAMAKAFHGNDLAMCAGCHHNSPASMTPPKCASCHGPKPDLATGKPGLKGAFHGQCITCHQKMEVKSVLATDCTKCHEKR